MPTDNMNVETSAGAEKEEQLKGFPRYRFVLEHNWKHFLIVNFITLIGLVPLALGVAYAVMSSSVLVLIPACIVGGIFAGPAIAGMVDCIFRALRTGRDYWWLSYKKQFKQNWKASIFPGIVYSLFIGLYVFMGFMMYQAELPPSTGTIALYLFCGIVGIMFFSVYFPQLVLFDQKTFIRLKNCILFFIKYFPRTLGVSVLQAVWWIIGVLFMPWTAFLVPFLGVWFIMFLSFFLLYPKLDQAFSIESRIEEQFPGQIEQIYED